MLQQYYHYYKKAQSKWKSGLDTREEEAETERERVRAEQRKIKKIGGQLKNPSKEGINLKGI